MTEIKALPAFEINRPHPEGKPIARLPTLGLAYDGPLSASAQFRIQGVDDYVSALHAGIDGAVRVSREIEGSIVEAAKALGATPPQAMAYARLSFMPDPANYGLMQWPGIQPESLRKIAQDNIAPQMIIRSRVSDMRRYSGLSTHPWKPGWEITLRDPDETPSGKQRDDIKAAQQFLLNCSREGVYIDPQDRDAHQIAPFATFLTGMVNDTLTFDGWSIWTDRDRVSRVRSFANLPAGLVRLAMPKQGFRGDPRVYAALVDETGTPVAAFTRDDMTWKVRNVRTDPAVIGYGWSEIEICVRLIQAFQAAVDLNADTFQRSGIPNGIMKLKGDFWQQEQVDALMREWTNMKRGVSKMWGMPVVAVPEDGDIEIMDFMDMKGQDVRYKDHMNMMMGCSCVVYQYPVRRLGMFVSGHGKDNQPVPDESVEQAGVDDPGLPALLQFTEDSINEYLLWPAWPHLQFGFRNKNPKEDARSYAELTKARTWKESRAAVDLSSLASIAPKWLKPMAEILELCPEDPSKVSAFQTMAVKMLESKVGELGASPDEASPGAPFPSLKDPAKTQEHGHRVGVRRNSAAEEARADA